MPLAPALSLRRSSPHRDGHGSELAAQSRNVKWVAITATPSRNVRLHLWAFYIDMRRMNETTNETAAGAGGMTPARGVGELLLRLTCGGPACQRRSRRSELVVDNPAMPLGGITLSERGGSRRTRRAAYAHIVPNMHA